MTLWVFGLLGWTKKKKEDIISGLWESVMSISHILFDILNRLRNNMWKIIVGCS